MVIKKRKLGSEGGKMEIPLEVQKELDKGWTLIWQTDKQILIGYGYYRKVWDFDTNLFFKITNGITSTLQNDEQKKKRRW